MHKAFHTFLFVLLAYVLPLAGRPGLMLHYKIGILALAAVVVFLTQPGLKAGEARAQRQQDRHSVLLILLLSLASALVPVVEWAYWHPDRHHAVFLGLGLGLIISGIGLRVWAISTLGPLFTATVQIREGHRLVQEGPYALLRHPSYTGAFMATLGSAVILESWMGLAVAAFAMGIAYQIRIEAEEKALAGAFGEKYLQYQQRAYKMIPYIW